MATSFNRDRFKAAKLDVNKKVSDEVEKTFSYSDSKRGDYHKIEEGKNYFRMMPPHGENEPSMQPKVVYWLDCRIEEMDENGKPTGKSSIKPRPIFDSRIHGGTPKDIIDEYIKFTKNVIFSSIQDKDERQKMLSPIQGWRDRSGKWNPGILANHSYVCYATKGDIKPENIGRLELWENDKKALEKLNIAEDSDEPIITDLFSDPNTGSQFVITKGKDDKGKLFTLISKRTFEPPRGTKQNDIAKCYSDFASSQVVPDDVLIKLSEMEPLSAQFKNAYKKADFNRALEALQLFDDKNGFGSFDNDEFIEIVKEIGDYYKESESKEQNDVSSNSKEIDLYDMTREELKAYIKENKYAIRVVGSMSEDVIRELILAIENPEEPEEKPEEPEEDQNEPGETSESNDSSDDDNRSDLEKNFEADRAEPVQTQPVMSLKDRLAELKKKSK